VVSTKEKIHSNNKLSKFKIFAQLLLKLQNIKPGHMSYIPKFFVVIICLLLGPVIKNSLINITLANRLDIVSQCHGWHGHQT